MPQNHEPFFSPDDLKAITLFRPTKWLEWWRTETFIPRAIAALVLCALCGGMFAFFFGDKDLGLIGLVWAGFLLGLVALFGFVIFIRACFRWTFQKSGLLDAWLAVRDRVIPIVRGVCWIGCAGFFLYVLWPYLSLDPMKSWIAVSNDVAAKQVEVEKEPHDCEFTTAPIGSKHCHYVSKAVIVFPDAMHPEKIVLVKFEKIYD